MGTPDLHPDLEPIAFLLGTWSGDGTGEYPTIEPFRYREQITFRHVGKPFLAYSQSTWSFSDGRPLHSETGYWRPKPDGALEVVLAHPSGVVEVYAGTVRGAAVDIATTVIGLAHTAKQVTALTRTFLIAGDLLTYEVRMAAVGEPLQHHLSAELRRDPSGT